MKSFRFRPLAPHDCVVGYLRRYQRWNGSPGLSLHQQRAGVRAVATERGYRVIQKSLIEQADGQARGWPVLHQAIQRAIDGADHNVLVVIPTLDGVQFNLSFLELLVGNGRIDDSPPIDVRSGWRRPRKLGVGTNYERRAESSGWLLSLQDEADAFATMVAAIRRRNRALSGAIQRGLRQAAARGVGLGSSRPGSYRLSRDEQCKGGAVTARLRRASANDPYREWVAAICRWRAEGLSLAAIALKLADRNVRTPEQRPMNAMLVHRILQRAKSTATG